MKVSVITVNLNNKDGLEQTLKSIVSQTFQDYEILVIDGLSTDGSVDIIKQYESQISYWVSEKDSGVYNAMNKGIKKAQGEYLYFLNSGDYLAHDNVIESVFANKTCAGFICGNFISEQNNKKIKQTPYMNRDWSFSLYDIYSGDLCHQAFFINAQNFRKYGLYKEDLRISSDWLLFFIAIALNDEFVAYRDVDIVIYNMDGMSSGIGGRAIYEERKKAVQNILTPQIAKKLDRLYFLEQNSYIVDNIRSNKFLYFLFRAYCKVAHTFGFLKTNKSH